MITGIILASGFSRRMQGEKLLLEIEGVPMIERVIRTAQDSHIDDLILVYRSEGIRTVADRYGVTAICNCRSDEGQSAAVSLGVKSACPGTEGFMFFVGDQPYLDAYTVNRLVEVFHKGKNAIVVPTYAGVEGNPVIFPSSLAAELCALKGDRGGKPIIDARRERVKLVPVQERTQGVDIDTIQDYEKVTESYFSKST